MNDKSFVTMEQKACIVCAKEFDTGTLLLDKRLRDTFDKRTVTGWGMCDECSELRADDRIALVACDTEKSNIKNDIVQPNDAYRLGPIIWIKEVAFKRIFNTPVPDRGVAFVEPAVITTLEGIMGEKP